MYIYVTGVGSGAYNHYYYYNNYYYSVVGRGVDSPVWFNRQSLHSGPWSLCRSGLLYILWTTEESQVTTTTSEQLKPKAVDLECINICHVHP